MSDYPHMCRDGHPQIGHSDSGDDERCPLCRERDRAEAAETRVERLEEALRKAHAAIKRHDSAPFQCESSAGAAGAMDCREILEAALAAGKESGDE